MKRFVYHCSLSLTGLSFFEHSCFTFEQSSIQQFSSLEFPQQFHRFPACTSISTFWSGLFQCGCYFSPSKGLVLTFSLLPCRSICALSLKWETFHRCCFRASTWLVPKFPSIALIKWTTLLLVECLAKRSSQHHVARRKFWTQFGYYQKVLLVR